jgi:putative transcriptional regulator
MRKNKKYRSEAMVAIHETMEALHKAGAVDKQTMRRFDEAWLTQVQIADGEADQGDPGARACHSDRFCELPNVTPNLVSKWEPGENQPSRPALKLLSLVEKHGLTAFAYNRGSRENVFRRLGHPNANTA